MNVIDHTWISTKWIGLRGKFVPDLLANTPPARGREKCRCSLVEESGRISSILHQAANSVGHKALDNQVDSHIVRS